MKKQTSYREFLKKSLDEAVKNGDTIIYCWPDRKEFQRWEHKLDNPEWFPTINAIIAHEQLRAGLKISWNGFPGPVLYAGTVKRLMGENDFEAFLDYLESRNFTGPVTLVPSNVTLFP